MKKIQPQFKVVNWDFNRKEVEYYDVIPYFINSYREASLPKNGQKWESYMKPRTKEELKLFVEGASLYRFCARCEYEVVIHQWPEYEGCEQKIDIHEQVMANIDVIVELLYKYIFE